MTSAIRLTVSNNELANGNGTNHYLHPQGFKCRWNMNVVFTRELEETKSKTPPLSFLLRSPP